MEELVNNGGMKGVAQPSINSPQCHFDGGDCCAETNAERGYGTGFYASRNPFYLWQGLTSVCIDPASHPAPEAHKVGGWGVPDPKSGAEPCSPGHYFIEGLKPWYGYTDGASIGSKADLCAQGVLPLPSGSVAYGAAICTPEGGGPPQCENGISLVNYTGYPPEYVAKYQESVLFNHSYDRHGNLAPVTMPSLYGNQIVAPSERPYEHDDFHDYTVDLLAGEYVDICVETGFGLAEDDWTIELIAPNDDGSAADPRGEERYRLQHFDQFTTPADTAKWTDFYNIQHDGRKMGSQPPSWTQEQFDQFKDITGSTPEEESLSDLLTWDNNKCVRETHRPNCQCNGAVCSCGTVVLTDMANPDLTQHCVPEPHPHYQYKVITNDHRVWLDPGPGGRVYKAEMSRFNIDDRWPMMLTVYRPESLREVKRAWELYRNSSHNPNPMCRTISRDLADSKGYTFGPYAQVQHDEHHSYTGTEGSDGWNAAGRHKWLRMPVRDDQDLYPDPAGDETFGFDEAHVAECCWPYAASIWEDKVCARRTNGVLGMGMQTGTDVQRAAAEVEFYATETGWYTFSAKGIGAQGGAYALNVYDTNTWAADLDVSQFENAARNINEDINGDRCESANPGDISGCARPMDVGETRLGVVEAIGAVDEFTFEANKYDYISVYAGPAYNPETPSMKGLTKYAVRDNIHWLCNFPYKMGFGCLDVQVTLVGPSGQTLGHADSSAYDVFVGAALPTVWRPPWPWAEATGYGSGFQEHVSGRLIVPESGTYTVRVSGYAGTNGDNSRYRFPQLKSTGAYYVQVMSLGRREHGAGELERKFGIDLLPPTCSEHGVPPEALKGYPTLEGEVPVSGCANFIWGGDHKTKHPKCEKFWPEGMNVAREHAPKTGCISDWRAQKTGSYTVRVRTANTNVLHSLSGISKPRSRDYRIKLRRGQAPFHAANFTRVRYHRDADLPTTFDLSSPPARPIAVGETVRITHKMSDTTVTAEPRGRYGAPGAALYEHVRKAPCADMHKFMVSENRPTRETAHYVQPLTFSATRGDRLCLRAVDPNLPWETSTDSFPHGPGEIRWDEMIIKVDGREIYRLQRSAGNMEGDYWDQIPDGNALELNGYEAPQTGVYEVLLRPDHAPKHPGYYCGDGYGYTSHKEMNCTQPSKQLLTSPKVKESYDPATGFWFDDTPLYGTFSLESCPEIVDVGYDELFTSQGLTDCDVWTPYLGIDRCMILPGANARVSDDLRAVTFTTGREQMAMTRFGIHAKLGYENVVADGPRYYWEIRVDGPGRTRIGLTHRHIRRDESLEDAFGSFVWAVDEDGDGGYCGSVLANTGEDNARTAGAYGFCVPSGSIVGVAYDVGRSTLAYSVDGFWQPTSAKGVNVIGTEFNRPPVKTCDAGMATSNGPGWTCSRNSGMPAENEACCPYDAEEWRTSPYPVGREKSMRCDDQRDSYFVAHDDVAGGDIKVQQWPWNWNPLFEVGGIAPSCVYSNPVNDGECTVGPAGRYGPGKSEHSTDLVAPMMSPTNMFKVYEDPVVRHQGRYQDFLMFPVVSGSKGRTYRFNFGEDETRPFAHQVPCGYEPLSNANLAADDPARAPTVTADCWTCKGTCEEYDDVADGECDSLKQGKGECPIHSDDADYKGAGSIGRGRCVKYAQGAGAFNYREHGMVDAYADGSAKLNRRNLPAVGFNEAPLSCEHEITRDCGGGAGFEDCQAWIDGQMATVVEHEEICPENAWWQQEDLPSHPESWRDVGHREQLSGGGERWTGGTYGCVPADHWMVDSRLKKKGVCSERMFSPWWPVNGTLHNCATPRGLGCPELTGVCFSPPGPVPCYGVDEIGLYHAPTD